MTIIVPELKQSHELLHHILDQPELPAIIQSLDAGVLTKLIHHIGLEDSAEIIALATVDQLKCIFDEDLWYSEVPGQDEVFDAERFGLWLEILFETGSIFAARKVMELDENLVTLGLCKLILVVDLDDLALYLSNTQRSTKDDMLDKILESTLNQEFDAYLVIAKSDSHWDAIQALLVELNELDHTMHNRLLERCYQISWEYIEDNGGLFDVLTSEEMLESDLAVDRETRREAQGFIMPSNAQYFLRMARITRVEKILDAKTLDRVSRAYFDPEKERDNHIVKASENSGPAKQTSSGVTASKVMRFLQTLQVAEVLPAPYQKRLSDFKDSLDRHLPLANALRILYQTDSTTYSKRLVELTYLSNILISGCEFQGRPFRPVEAAEAAISVCNLGSEYLIDTEAGKNDNQLVEIISALLAEHRLVKLFQVGWKILNDAVVLHSAKALLKFLDGHGTDLQDMEQIHEMNQMADILRPYVSSGKPWEANRQLDQLHFYLDGETTVTLMALLQEYPTLSDVICRNVKHRLSPFIKSHAHICSIRQFLKSALNIQE